MVFFTMVRSYFDKKVPWFELGIFDDQVNDTSQEHRVLLAAICAVCVVVAMKMAYQMNTPNWP
jgi:hypothetical protein